MTKNKHPPPQPNVELSREQKEIALLSIIAAMGGETDSSEGKWQWLNWFCDDENERGVEDTFNRCEAKGWIFTTHNSDWDTSTTRLTKAGRAALATTEGKDNG